MSPATTRRGLPTREALRGRGLNLYDLLLAVGIIGLLYVVVKLGQAMTVNFAPGRTQVKLNTDVSNVPYYAARHLSGTDDDHRRQSGRKLLPRPAPPRVFGG
jgi:hypothetical protein